jgi:hypothetical protein
MGDDTTYLYWQMFWIVVVQAGYDLVEVPAFNADKLDGTFLQVPMPGWTQTCCITPVQASTWHLLGWLQDSIMLVDTMYNIGFRRILEPPIQASLCVG